jgi:hypothetical protein
MRIHPLALAALLAVASDISTDAFEAIFSWSKPTTSKGKLTIRHSYENHNDDVLRRLKSVVAGASPATTRLYMFENSDNNERYYDHLIDLSDESMATSFSLADADPLQESTPTQQGDVASETAATPEASSPPASSTTQAAGGGAFSAIAATSTGASIGAVAFGGLAVARSLLGQRRKKLDEEKRNLEEQQNRLQTEADRLQKDTTQSNVLLVSPSIVLSLVIQMRTRSYCQVCERLVRKEDVVCLWSESALNSLVVTVKHQDSFMDSNY